LGDRKGIQPVKNLAPAVTIGFFEKPLGNPTKPEVNELLILSNLQNNGLNENIKQESISIALISFACTVLSSVSLVVVIVNKGKFSMTLCCAL